MASASSSSPVKSIHKSNANGFPDTNIRRPADQVHILMEREMRSQWVGPMTVKQFFKAFMEVSNIVELNCPKIDKQIFNDVSKKATEKAMYAKWLEIMSSIDILPGYKLVNTSSKPDVLADQLWRIDLTCYHKDVDVNERVNQLDKAEWGIEFKKSDADDPFGDKENFVNYDDNSPAGHNAKESRGQLAMYAAEWFSHQHRTHMFSIFVSKTKARFLYFDRSGVVVTESFDYAEDATPLVRFMWYFSHLTPEQKGIDATVRVATDDQAKQYREKLTTFHKRVAMLEVFPTALAKLKDRKKEMEKEKTKGKYTDGAKKKETTDSDDDLTDADWDILWSDMESSIHDSMSPQLQEKVATLVQERMPSENRAVVVIGVPCDKTETGYREVIGQGFSSSAESLVGRSTRAFPVWDPLLNKLLYLKDAWRSRLAKIQKETDILKELNAAGVNRVPLLISGGDVGTQKTRTENFAKQTWVQGKVVLTPRAHHRFLVDFIGRSIRYFSHSKQMLQAVYDAFNAHKEAWEICGILHRDISVNNVMLDRWGRGVLNDWDLSKKENDTEIGPRTHARTGTWYFMSTMLLQKPGKKHGVHDDLESFVLLVLYLVLSYLDHSHLDGLGQFMVDFFEECTVDAHTKAFTGGNLKFFIFVGLRTHFLDTFKVNNNKPLDFWMRTALDAVSKWVKATWNISGVETKDLSKEALFNHNFLSTKFKDALTSEDWPTVTDKRNNEVLGDDGMYLRRKINSGSDPSGTKRSRENASTGPRKKAKKSSEVQSMDALPEEEEVIEEEVDDWD